MEAVCFWGELAQWRCEQWEKIEDGEGEELRLAWVRRYQDEELFVGLEWRRVGRGDCVGRGRDRAAMWGRIRGAGGADGDGSGKQERARGRDDYVYKGRGSVGNGIMLISIGLDLDRPRRG